MQKGDVGYIPQGYGHSIENVGSGRSRMLIGFNAGIYETIDLYKWIAANPKDVLATNFGQPAEMFGNSRIAMCSSPKKTELKSAQPIRIERMGEEYADADEDEECRHSLCHSLPP